MTRALLQELGQLLDMLVGAHGHAPLRQSEALFHGVVIAAGPTSFAIGAELEEVSQLDGIRARDFARMGQHIFDQIERSPLPVVAAIRGYCLGGGLDLALACHARVASYDASLGHPGPTLGLLTGWGGTQRLPRRLGKSGALQVLLTAQRIPATQALTLGLLNELVPSQELLSAACRHAERLYSLTQNASALLRCC
jgi:enoyl-CoA hydratase